MMIYSVTLPTLEFDYLHIYDMNFFLVLLPSHNLILKNFSCTVKFTFVKFFFTNKRIRILTLLCKHGIMIIILILIIIHDLKSAVVL